MIEPIRHAPIAFLGLSACGFSTKGREPWLQDPVLRGECHAFLGGVSKQLDCPSVIVGGVEDHVHLLARFGRGVTQSDWVKELKRVSNRWIKERDGRLAGFAWQGGIFSELAFLTWGAPF